MGLVVVRWIPLGGIRWIPLGGISCCKVDTFGWD